MDKVIESRDVSVRWGDIELRGSELTIELDSPPPEGQPYGWRDPRADEPRASRIRAEWTEGMEPNSPEYASARAAFPPHAPVAFETMEPVAGVTIEINTIVRTGGVVVVYPSALARALDGGHQLDAHHHHDAAKAAACKVAGCSRTVSEDDVQAPLRTRRRSI